MSDFPLSYDIAVPDHDRQRRLGFPEVIYGEGKDSSDIADIIKSLLNSPPSDELRGSVERTILITRLSSEKIDDLSEHFSGARANKRARTFIVNPPENQQSYGEDEKFSIAVLTAGTSDVSVAEEVCETLYALQIPCELICDVGVAGLHRLLHRINQIEQSSVAIVCAGMDGALPSVLGGLVQQPIIAVPVSVGYGAGKEGIAPLLSMLNSCSPGVLVTNIDAGFTAAFAAFRMKVMYEKSFIS